MTSSDPQRQKRPSATARPIDVIITIFTIIIDRFYIALFSALEQTHSART